MSDLTRLITRSDDGYIKTVPKNDSFTAAPSASPGRGGRRKVTNMQLDQAGYRTWDGRRRSPWWGCWSIVRVGLMLIFRRWVFWILLGLGLLNFLFHFAFIYLKATITVQTGTNMARALDNDTVTLSF